MGAKEAFETFIMPEAPKMIDPRDPVGFKRIRIELDRDLKNRQKEGHLFHRMTVTLDYYEKGDHLLFPWHRHVLSMLAKARDEYMMALVCLRKYFDACTITSLGITINVTEMQNLPNTRPCIPILAILPRLCLLILT